MSSDPYIVLGVSRNDPIDVIKKRYRKLVLKFHPDKAAYSGIDPEIANNEFMKINDAWKKIEENASENVSENGSENNFVWFTHAHADPTFVFFGDIFGGVFHDLKKTEFTNLEDFMEFMNDNEESPQEARESQEINQGIDDLFESICKIQTRNVNTIDTKNILQNIYSPSIEILLYVPWTDIEKKKTKSMSYSRSRRCNVCAPNVCKACNGQNIMNCKKCLQHGFFIKKNCESCQGTGYIKSKHKIRVKLEHQQEISFYIYPEESDEKKGYDYPGDVYVKVIAE
jgi:DnaJ-class molecular chaperone